MEAHCHDFPARACRALGDAHLQSVFRRFGHGFVDKRAQAAANLPEFEALRDQGRDLRNHVLDHLDHYLERFESRVIAAGGHVHWCRDAAEACETVLKLCRAAEARLVTKGKSMVAEEVGLNGALEAAGLAVVETDLGEYIIQLRQEPPSHIIAPAIHVTKEEVAEAFRAHHPHLPPERVLDQAIQLVDEARTVLRQRYQEAEVGITGANFLIAESGSAVLVTNEGNGDLTQLFPKTHIVITGIEKVVPTFEDAALLLRLLARSATGQEFSAYTTVTTGPRRAEDADGPREFHVVLVDNGRSRLLGSEFREVLRCIRCGACMNHCPVYGAVGGHAYGWVYPGPIGAVLDPALVGVAEAHHLPGASTFCGRCEAVCPTRIPLPDLMRHWRERAFEAGLMSAGFRRGLGLWAWAARRPWLYRLGTRLAVGVLGWLGGRRGRFRRLPLAGAWTAGRDLPAPEGGTFQDRWARSRRRPS
jgi:L-lactate dehydrogenase complex protein LldF